MTKENSIRSNIKINKSKMSIRYLKNITKHMIHRKNFSRFLRVLGPGVVTGAADDDPSGIATYSQAGASQGLGLLWSFPIMYPMMLSVQGTCSKIGAITGKGLAAVIKENYNKKVLYILVLLVVIANTINIGADIGAMAEVSRLFIDLPYEFLTLLYVLIIIVLVVFVEYKKYVKILKWLAITLLAYPITSMFISIDWLEVFRASFMTIPKINSQTIYILVGVFGTTISPYLFFWDTSETVEEGISKRYISQNGNVIKNPKTYLRSIKIDNFFGMTLSEITAWFIVIVSSFVLFKNGIHNIDTAADAAKALEPLVNGFPYSGVFAKLIFSFGVIGTGLLAVPILAGSSAYAISETFGWREGLYRKFKKAIGFYLVIIVATIIGLVINLIGIDPIQALIFTAVFNGIASIPLIFIISKIGNNKNIMGEYKNGILSNLFIKFTFIFMTIAVILLFIFIVLGR